MVLIGWNGSTDVMRHGTNVRRDINVRIIQGRLVYCTLKLKYHTDVDDSLIIFISMCVAILDS
jgi:hypothetical protein